MSIPRLIVSELLGMFIDDGNLAILVAVQVGLVSTSIVWLGLPALLGGVLIAAGCIVTLAWSVMRAARR